MLAMLVESAMLYLAVMTAYLVLLLTKNTTYLILADCVCHASTSRSVVDLTKIVSQIPSIIGITFTAIIIRISMGFKSNDGKYDSSSYGSHRQITTIGGSRRLVNDTIEKGSKPHKIEVHVDIERASPEDLESLDAPMRSRSGWFSKTFKGMSE